MCSGYTSPPHPCSHLQTVFGLVLHAIPALILVLRFPFPTGTGGHPHTLPLSLSPPSTLCLFYSLLHLLTRDRELCLQRHRAAPVTAAPRSASLFSSVLSLTFQSLLVTQGPAQHPCTHGTSFHRPPSDTICSNAHLGHTSGLPCLGPHLIIQLQCQMLELGKSFHRCSCCHPTCD